MRRTRTIKIGVLGHVGNGNLGDEAIIASVVGNIRERLPQAELVGITLRPADTARRHGIVAFPIRRAYAATHPWDATAVAPGIRRRVGGRLRRGIGERLRDWLRGMPPLLRALKGVRTLALVVRQVILEVPFLFQSYRRLSSMSLLIIAGSQQLSDIKGGPWWSPATVFKWTLLARLRRVRVAIVSVGAGPLDSALSRWFVRCTVSMATYRSYRDEISRDCIGALGVREPGQFAPDLAFGLPSSSRDVGPAPQPTVVINPMPAFIWRDYDHDIERALYANYAEALTAFAAWLLDRGYRVALLATQLRGDPPVIGDILERLTKERPGVVEQGHAFMHRVDGFEDLLAGLRLARIVVATRFHGAVLGCYAGRPVLALAYHPKMRDLMAQMGDPQCVVEAQGIRLEALQAAFLDLEQRSHEISAQRPSRLAAVRLALAAQYDHLAELANGGRPAAVSASPTRARVA